MSPLHLVLVEDDEDSAEAMSALFRAQGIDVACANSGEEALDLFRNDPRRPVDVILLDLMLPDMSGAALVAALRTIITLPRVVIHSAVTLAEAQHAAHEVGAFAVLRKPTDWSEVRGVLDRCREILAGAVRNGNA